MSAGSPPATFAASATRRAGELDTDYAVAHAELGFALTLDAHYNEARRQLLHADRLGDSRALEVLAAMAADEDA